MVGHVYKQTWEHKLGTIRVTHAALEHGYGTTPCLDCGGTGKFEIPDGEIGVMYEPGEGLYVHVPCTACKGSGSEFINLC